MISPTFKSNHKTVIKSHQYDGYGYTVYRNRQPESDSLRCQVCQGLSIRIILSHCIFHSWPVAKRHTPHWWRAAHIGTCMNNMVVSIGAHQRAPYIVAWFCASTHIYMHIGHISHRPCSERTYTCRTTRVSINTIAFAYSFLTTLAHKQAYAACAFTLNPRAFGAHAHTQP